MFKSIGRLVYDPPSHVGNTKNWLVLMCDDEISRYYRYLYTKEYYFLNADYSTKLTRPIFGAHISLIRGEKISKQYQYLWKNYHNQMIEFEYDPGVKDNKEYYWLNVKCDALLNIRSAYGLSRQPKFGLHLTVGRITNI